MTRTDGEINKAGQSHLKDTSLQGGQQSSRPQKTRSNTAAKAKNATTTARLGPTITSRHKRFTGALGRERGRGIVDGVETGPITLLGRPQHKTHTEAPHLISNPHNTLPSTDATRRARGTHNIPAGNSQTQPHVPQSIKGKEVMGLHTAQQDQSGGSGNKRKPSAQIKIPNRPKGAAKRIVQQAKGGKKSNQAAQPELTRDGFFQVHVDMQLCSEIGKACGTTLEGVAQALADDNADRRANHFAHQQQITPDANTLSMPTGEEETGDLDLDFEIDPDDQFDTDEECQ